MNCRFLHPTGVTVNKTNKKQRNVAWDHAQRQSQGPNLGIQQGRNWGQDQNQNFWQQNYRDYQRDPVGAWMGMHQTPYGHGTTDMLIRAGLEKL